MIITRVDLLASPIDKRLRMDTDMIQFGEENVKRKYENGKEVLSHTYVMVKDPVTDDSDELAQMIRFTREHKDAKHISFKRVYSDKGNRFLEKEWRNDK